jgi:hypothetical protein
MDEKALKETAIDELVQELRRRDRHRGAGGERSAKRTSARISMRRRDLHDVPTGELVRITRDRQRVVYGTDDREDVRNVQNKNVQRVAASVVALVKTEDLVSKAGGYKLRTESYQEAYDLCGSERFASQPIGCFCSGFLVAPDIIATAGHCVESDADLPGVRFVFGFRMRTAEDANVTFAKDDVYAGKKVIGRQFSGGGADWALVRLDRPVIGRAPLAIRRVGKVGNSQKLFVLGHPCGLPLKYAPAAQVRTNSHADFFVANLDTYGGNSGSPVFNAGNRVVEGILVRGETDFVSNGSCSVSLVCPTSGCRGEDVTRSTRWAAKVPKAKAKAKKSARP